MNKFAIICHSSQKSAVPEGSISILFKPAELCIKDACEAAGAELICEDDYSSGDVMFITPRLAHISPEIIEKTYKEFCACSKDALSFADGNLIWKKDPSCKAEACGEDVGISPIFSSRDLFSAERTIKETVIEKHLDGGVIFRSTDGVIISPDAVIEAGAEILPGTIIKGNSRISSGAVIGPNSIIDNSSVGENTVINASHLLESTVGRSVQIGPFSQLRPNTVVKDKAHIGDFVELKNSSIGEGTCVAHLTYVGDSDVGKNVNFGCGVVTVNYNGESKNRCHVGDYAFIGCNTNLVAPVSVGNAAYTAAGSTVTEDVPDGALAIARSRQTIKEDWAKPKLKAYIEKKNKE